MSEYPGLNGTSVFIADSIIRRFKSIDYNDPNQGSKIDYATGYLLTPLTTDEIMARLDNVEYFIALTVRTGAPVFLNSTAVLSVRPSLPINGDGTELNIGGLYQHVIEDYDTVIGHLNL